MSFSITFSNPQNNYAGTGGISATVPVAYWAHRHEFGAVSSLVVAIETSVLAKYALETSHTTNPVQLRSTGELKRGSDTWFTGEVVDKPLTRAGIDGGNFIIVTLHGSEGALNGTICPDAGGGYRWTLATDSVEVTDLPLKSTLDFGDFEGATLWPDPADATGAKCYLQDADSPQDELSAAIASTDVPPFFAEMSTDNPGFSARGWVKINSEWFYMDGCDDTGTGGVYRAHIRARAQLGTTAANHSIGDTVYNKLAKQIRYTKDLLNSGTPLRIDKEFVVLAHQGCFLLGSGASGTYTSTHSRYDDDSTLDAGSVKVTLEDVIEAICTAPRDAGGAGFDPSELDFDALNIGITHYDYDPEVKPEYALPAINGAISELSLQNEVQFWFNHTTGKFRLGIPADDTPALTLTHVERVEQDYSSDGIASAVLVIWEDDASLNRVHSDRSWHVGCDNTGAKPEIWRRTSEGGADWREGTFTENTSGTGSSFGMDVLHDGKTDSKLRADFFHDPGGVFDFGHFWFGDGTTPPMLQLDYIGLRFGVFRAIEGWNRSRANADFTYHVALQGCVDYDTTTNTGTWFDLGCEAKGKPVPGEGVPAPFIEFSEFLQRGVNAIRVTFPYMPGQKQDGDYYWGDVHELIIRGKETNFTLVQTSDTEQGESNYLYAPASHRKVRGGTGASTSAGTPLTKIIRIGASSESAARTIGRAALKTALQLYQQVTVKYTGLLPAKPELGDTLAVIWDGGGSANYTGVLRGMDIRYDHRRGIDAEFRILSSNPELIQ